MPDAIDPDEVMRNLEQRRAHLRERKELLDETVDEGSLVLAAALEELRQRGLPLPDAMLKNILDLADMTPEACQVVTDALTLAVNDDDGYDARRFRSEAAELRRLASTLDLIASVLDYEDQGPATE